MTAFQSMMLSGHGLPDMPPGGSVESRLKSRIRRLLQFVDWNRSIQGNISTRTERRSAHHRSWWGGQQLHVREGLITPVCPCLASQRMLFTGVRLVQTRCFVRCRSTFAIHPAIRPVASKLARSQPAFSVSAKRITILNEPPEFYALLLVSVSPEPYLGEI